MSTSPLFLNFEPTLLDASWIVQHEAQRSERDMRYGNALASQRQQRASMRSRQTDDKEMKLAGPSSWWEERLKQYNVGKSQMEEGIMDGLDSSDPAFVEAGQNITALSPAFRADLEKKDRLFTKYEDRVNDEDGYADDLFTGAGGIQTKTNDKGEVIGLVTNKDAAEMAYENPNSIKWNWASGGLASGQVIDLINKSAANAGSIGSASADDPTVDESIGKIVNLVENSSTNDPNLLGVINNSVNDFYGRYENQMKSMYANSNEGREAITKKIADGGVLNDKGEVDMSAFSAKITKSRSVKNKSGQMVETPSWLMNRLGEMMIPHMKSRGSAFRQLIGQGGSGASGSVVSNGPVNGGMNLNLFQNMMLDSTARTRSGKNEVEASFEMFSPAIATGPDGKKEVIASRVKVVREDMGLAEREAYGKTFGTIAEVSGQSVNILSEPLPDGEEMYAAGGTIIEGDVSRGLVLIGVPNQYQVVPQFSETDPEKSVQYNARKNETVANRRQLVVGGSTMGVLGSYDQAKNIHTWVVDEDQIDATLAQIDLKYLDSLENKRVGHEELKKVGLSAAYDVPMPQRLALIKTAVKDGKLDARKIPMKKVSYAELMDNEELAAAYNLWYPEAHFTNLGDQDEAHEEIGMTEEQVNHAFSSDTPWYSGSRQLFRMDGIAARMDDDLLSTAISKDKDEFKGAVLTTTMWDRDPDSGKSVAAQKTAQMATQKNFDSLWGQ